MNKVTVAEMEDGRQTERKDEKKTEGGLYRIEERQRNEEGTRGAVSLRKSTVLMRSRLPMLQTVVKNMILMLHFNVLEHQIYISNDSSCIQGLFFFYFYVIKGIARVVMTLAFTSSNHMKPVAFEC